jgi:hypothetical protein
MIKRYRSAPLTAFACLGMLACSGVNEAEVPEETQVPEAPGWLGMLETPKHYEALLALEAGEPAVSPAASDGSVELEPNVLRGTARLTNTNPEIRELLATDPWRWGRVIATSTSPSGFSASTPWIAMSADPLQFSFEMLMESGAGGNAGVTYNVRADRYSRFFFPLLTGVNVRPRSVQPSPTEVTFEGCLGAVEIKFGTEQSCQTPVAVQDVSVDALSVYQKGTGRYIGYTSGDATISSFLNFSVQTQYGPLFQRRPIQFNPSCDQVARQCIVLNPGTLPPRGTVEGPFDIGGEDIRSNAVQLINGPSGSPHVAPQPPLAPVSDPSSWWRMTVFEGDYRLAAPVRLRSGRQFTNSELPWVSPDSTGNWATIPGNQTTSLAKVVDGEVRYPFAVRPAKFFGSVRLADPFVPKNPGSYSSLQTLVFGADYDSNGDGIPNNPGIQNWTALRGSTHRGWSFTAFPGTFAPSTGELASSYELLLPNTYDIPRTWTQEYLHLLFSSEGPSVTTRPGLYDPERFRYGSLGLYPQANSRLMAPGEQWRVDHEYCFNEVQLQYSTTFGRFFNPVAQITRGIYDGLDWRNQPVKYSVGGSFYGIPAVHGGNFDPRQYAGTLGLVSMALPQGTYTIKPSASMVSDTGEINTATFTPIENLVLGCGSRVVPVPPLTVVVTPPAACATSGQIQVSGRVLSGQAQVGHIWYRLNGGPAVDLCPSNCGSNPSFSFPVMLQSCQNTIEVFAFTEGMNRPASNLQNVVWDDPADGPSCAGTFCVNRPPVARCRNVTVPLDETCSQGMGSVNDSSYDPDQGDTVTCVQTPDGPYGAGTNRVTLTCTDTAGLQSSCDATVTVKDLTPPQVVCPDETELVCRDGGAVASYSPTATDNCGGAPSVVCLPAAGSRLPPGTTAVTCTATDAASNRASCTFPVNVVDTEPPTVTCPAPVTAECTGESGATVTLPEATAADTCQVTNVTQSGGPRFPLGTTPVTYTARDPGGNTAVCTTPVTVRDTQAPTLRMVSRTLELVCGTSPILGVRATDVCQGDLTSQVEALGLGTAPGTYQVNYRVRDASGNTAVVGPRTVTISNRDELMLVITGDRELDLECNVDEYVDLGATAWDGCNQPLVVDRFNSGDDDGDGIPAPGDPVGEAGPGPNTAVEGSYSVQYIGHYPDPNRCTSVDPPRCPEVMDTRTVRVRDTLPPTLRLNGPQQMTHQCGGAWTDPGWQATDACYGDLSAAVSRTGYVNGWVPGEYTVRYEVRDTAGHSAQAVTRTVRVVEPCMWR